jgi:hypothetical protein
LIFPSSEFLFMNDFQKYLPNHQRQGGISTWIFYFNQIRWKIKKWEQKIKIRIICNKPIDSGHWPCRGEMSKKSY